MIYLACPYTHPDELVRMARFRAANLVAAKLILSGEIVYSPISHMHPIAEEHKLPIHWTFWKKSDEFFIRACSKVVVLQVAGWDKSYGVMREIELAKELEKPVEYLEWP
jgi:hypothetical protein